MKLVVTFLRYLSVSEKIQFDLEASILDFYTFMDFVSPMETK